MTTATDLPVVQTRRRLGVTAAAVWLWWLVMVVCAAIFIARHGLDIPRQDEWTSFAQLFGVEPISLSWLWSFQNEHRIPLQRVLYIASIRAAGLDFRGGMFLNLAMLAAAAGLFMLAARRLRGRWSWVDLAFPALFLNLGQHENYLNSFQIQFVVGALLTTGLAVQFLLMGDRPTWRHFAGVGTTLLLLPLDGGTTLVFVPPVALWMLLAMVLVWRSGRPGRLKSVAVGLLCLGLCAAICVAYFRGFARTTQPVFSAWGLFRGICEFACTAWGTGCIAVAWVMVGIPGFILGGAAMVSLCGIAALALLQRLWTDQQSRLRALGLLAVFGGFALLIGSIGYGRGMVAELWGTSPRYAGLLTPALALCILLLNLHQARALRWLGTAAAAVALITLVPNTRDGLLSARRQDDSYAALQRDVVARLPIDALAMRHAPFLYVSDVPFTERWLLEMQQHRLGPFALLSAPLQRYSAGLVRIPITAAPVANDMRLDQDAGVWESTGADPFLVYPLPAIAQIASIRVIATITRPPGAQRVEPYTGTDYFWAQDPPERFHPVQRHQNIRNPVGSQIDQRIWIFGKANKLRIDPDVWPCRFELKRMEMLAVPADAATNPLYQLAQGTISTVGDPPYLVDGASEPQQLVFRLPTTFHVDVAGKQSLTLDVGPWHEETFRRVQLHISGPGVDVQHMFIPGNGPLQVELPPGASSLDLEFTSRQPPGQVRAAISRFELR